MCETSGWVGGTVTKVMVGPETPSGSAVALSVISTDGMEGNTNSWNSVWHWGLIEEYPQEHYSRLRTGASSAHSPVPTHQCLSHQCLSHRCQLTSA